MFLPAIKLSEGGRLSTLDMTFRSLDMQEDDRHEKVIKGELQGSFGVTVPGCLAEPHCVQ